MLITHGSNDQRVPIQTMTEFIEKIKTTPFEHKVVIEDGEGHKPGSLQKQIERYTQLAEFLNRVVLK